eukprot:scaffold32917_cov59-Attheya_sp.AAC.1
MATFVSQRSFLSLTTIKNYCNCCFVAARPAIEEKSSNPKITLENTEKELEVSTVIIPKAVDKNMDIVRNNTTSSDVNLS